MLNTLLLAGFAALTLADDVPEVGDGFVRFPVTGVQPAWSVVGRRQDEADLKNQQVGASYTIQLGIGSPAQLVSVQLDTGSTDLWVNPNCNNLRGDDSKAFCTSLGHFNSASSSSYKSLGTSYTILYGIGNVTLDWATDNIVIGSSSIKTQQFGVASNSFQEPFGILGVGPNVGGKHPVYPYFIDTLAAQGLTASRAFSLDLRSIESLDGSIIFGGLDTKKFTGSLEKLPIIAASQAPDGDRYWVNIASIAVNSGAGSSATVLNTPVQALLDSGSTLTQLPAAAFRALAAAFPTARLDPQGSGYYLVDCAVANQAGSVDFTFGKKTIKVAYKDFIWHGSATVCVLGALPISSDVSVQIPILGDTFLRAAYAIFDQDNRNIHLAQAANCGTNVISIGKGVDAVPSVTGDCGASATGTSTTSKTSSTTGGSSKGTTSSTSTPTTITSTIKSTTVYTVTKCPVTITDCPVGHVTTEVITRYTTYCPDTETPTYSKPPSTTAKPSSPGSASGTISITRTTSTSAAASTTRVVTAGVGKVVANAGAGIAAAVAVALL